MTSSQLDSPAALGFAALAAEYCAAIEEADRSTRAALLRRIERLLPLLYHAAVELPDVEPDTSEVLPSVLPPEESSRVHHALGRLLGARDRYWEVFNPADAADHEPVARALSSDLAEIHQDLHESLQLVDSGAGVNDVLWEWKFSFTSHWGSHAASALRVVNALLRTEYVDALEDLPPPDAERIV